MLRDSEAGSDEGEALWIRIVTCVDEAEGPRLGEMVVIRGGSGGREVMLKVAARDEGWEMRRTETEKEGGGGRGAGRWTRHDVPE